MLPTYELKIVNSRLRELGFRNLQEYYESPLWKDRKRIYEEMNGREKCDCCWELCWLCENCHEYLHMQVNEIIHDVLSENGSCLFDTIQSDMAIRAYENRKLHDANIDQFFNNFCPPKK